MVRVHGQTDNLLTLQTFLHDNIMNKRFTVPFLLLAVLFCIFLVVANLLEVKVVKLGPLSATAGLVVFPLSYIINDCIVEVYGFQRARFVIWLGFLMNLVVVLLVQALWSMFRQCPRRVVAYAVAAAVFLAVAVLDFEVLLVIVCAAAVGIVDLAVRRARKKGGERK